MWDSRARASRQLVALTALGVAQIAPGLVLWLVLPDHTLATILLIAGVVAITIGPLIILMALGVMLARQDRALAAYAVATVAVTLIGVFLALTRG